MKKWLALVLAATMVFSFAACSPSGGEDNGDGDVTQGDDVDVDGPADMAEVNIGAAIYKFDDTFMSGVRNTMQSVVDTLNGSGMEVTIDIVDSQSNQALQNDQVDSFLTKGLNALIINPVDRTSAGPIIEKAMGDDIPIVFVNREPESDDMQSYDKVWYVGAKAEESGTMSGQIIVDYFEANPEADRNGDGKIQYVMLTGEPGHQDATLRTEYSVKAIEDAGWEAEALAEDTANWDKAEATNKMNTIISSVGIENIEAVLANNDDMALGAIEALKANGYNIGDESKYIPVVGVDATSPALEAMQNGELLGTVLNDATNQGTAAVNIAVIAANNMEVSFENVGYEVTDDKYVWIPYVKVTAENLADFLVTDAEDEESADATSVSDDASEEETEEE